MRSGLIVLVTVIVATVAGLFYYAQASPYKVSASVAKQMIESDQVDLVLDVRTQLERDTIGFYPGSVHIPSAELSTRMPIEYPNKDIRIVVYCNTGQRARRATEILYGLGYENVVYIAGSHFSLM